MVIFVVAIVLLLGFLVFLKKYFSSRAKVVNSSLREPNDRIINDDDIMKFYRFIRDHGKNITYNSEEVSGREYTVENLIGDSSRLIINNDAVVSKKEIFPLFKITSNEWTESITVNREVSDCPGLFFDRIAYACSNPNIEIPIAAKDICRKLILRFRDLVIKSIRGDQVKAFGRDVDNVIL